MYKYELILAVLCVIICTNKQQVLGTPMSATGKTDLAPINRTTVGATETTQVSTSVSKKHRGRRHRRRHDRMSEEEFKNAMAKQLENIETLRKGCINDDETLYYDIATDTCRSCETCRIAYFSGSCTMQCRTYFTAQRLQEDLDWQNNVLLIVLVVSSIAVAALLFGIFALYTQCRKTSKMREDVDDLKKKFTSRLASSDAKGANNNAGCEVSSMTLHSEADLQE